MDNEMMVRVMDPILIKIYNIKNIEEIRFKDLAPSSRGERFTVLPMLYIMYDGGKYFAMSAAEKYFDVFVKKVFQVYNLEKDRVIVDPAFDPFRLRTKLDIDERTKKVFESGDLSKVNEIYSSYDGKKSYERSLLFQSDELRLLLPVVKYHLKQIFDCTDRVITLEDNYVNGYRNNYSIGCKLDGIDDILMVNFVSHNNNESELYIRSRDKKFKPVRMRLSFGKDSISVSTYFEDYNMLSSNVYQANKDNSVTSTFTVHKDGKCIVFKNEILEKVDNPLPNITTLDSSDDVIWYKLPWNAYYGVKNVVEVLSEIDHVVMIHNKYLAIVDDEFMLKEYASKEYQRKQTYEANANRVVMDEVNKRIYGLLLNSKEGIYLIETYFADVMRGNGYYEAYLDDRYFYHIAQNKDRLIGLNRSDLVGISQDNNIIHNADLLVMDDIKRLLKR